VAVQIKTVIHAAAVRVTDLCTRDVGQDQAMGRIPNQEILHAAAVTMVTARKIILRVQQEGEEDNFF
jgi:hypothetical protein